MQINKKLSTIAITALLLLSILAVVAPAYAAVAAVAPAPATGIVGSKTLIAVTGASPGGQLMVYWQNLAGIVLSNSTTYADGAGACNIVVTIPDAAATGTGTPYSIIVKDVSTGSTVGATGGFTVTPSISPLPTRGIPGDSVTVTGTGFGASKNINVTFNGVDVTPLALQVSSATGNVSVVFTVPTIIYGPYNVVASDNATVSNVSPAVVFTVGAAVTISPTSGPAGTIVTATGRGFTNTAGLTVTITIGVATAKNVTLIKTLADGTFSGQFVVPSSLAVQSTRYTVTASDGTISGSTSGATGGFRVTGTTEITLTPTSGQPGATITVVGVNFTAVAGTAVTLKFNVLTVGTFTTDVSGGFSGTFTVPSLPTTTYTVAATDANSLTASKSFAVAITLLNISPTSGPTGTVITVTGFGFGATTGTTANVTIGATKLGPDVTVAALIAGTTFIVPTLPVGAYTVTATDDAGLTASVTFTVTATTAIAVTPSTAPLGSPVTITASNFKATAATAITVDLINSTSTFIYHLNPVITASTGFTATQTNGTGYFKGTFTIPLTGSGLLLGTYTINATDAQGLNATTTFTIGAATVSVSTRAAQYAQGAIVSFNVQSTFADIAAIIAIVDPTGFPAASVALPTWVASGGLQVVPVASAQFTLSSDAAIGQYNWSTTIAGTAKSGNFQVVAAAAGADGNVTNADLNATLAGINTKLNTLNVTVNGLTTSLSALDAKVTSISGSVATLSTSMGTVTASVNSLSASISSISSGMATVQTSLGSVTTTLSSIDAVLGFVANDTATISTSVGTLKTSLASIGTTVTSIDGNVATIQTDLGTLKGTVTSIKDGVAIIQTDVGTLQISVGNLQTDVTSTKDSTTGIPTLVYIAIVLALIAAIAAVFCVIIVRQKIAS